ncbi:MATE family efflux transporter [bacterium]|nr:MATE family efflux transporter [bacterium]
MLIEKARLKTIVGLSLPIVGGMLAQNIMSLIDTAMVGRLGTAALASVGVGNFLFLLILSAVLGLSAGVQALVARRIGENEADLAGLDLNAGMLISSVIGLVLVAVSYLVLPYLYPLVNQDPLVAKKGLAYLRPRIPSMILIGSNVCFRAYWNGVSLPRWTLLSLLVAMVMNIISNYLLIFGNLGFPRLETAGAGLATTVAVFSAFLTNIGLGLKYARKNGFLRGLPSRERIQTLVRVSVPDSVRHFLMFLGLVVFFWIVGLLGTQELAAFNIIINIMLVALLPAMGMGTAALTLVGQALGRQEPRDAKRWGWEVGRFGAGVMILFAICVVPFPEKIAAVFVQDQNAIRISAIPLQILGLFMWIEAFGMIISFGLLGAGATQVVMRWALFIQWGLSLPLNWFFGVYLGYGLAGMFINGFFMVLMRTAIFSYIWHREHWTRIKF